MESETLKEPAPTEETAHNGKGNGSNGADARGRLIAAAAVVAVGGAFIAAGVAGIFQLISRFTAKCPQDLPVNDPAPELWKKLMAPELGGQTLGVPEKAAAAVAFKSGGK
jgi:hypothetical protein